MIDQAIGQTQLERLIPRQTLAGEEQPLRGLMAYQARQRICHAKAGVITQCAEVGREARLLAGHAEIRHQRQAQPGANGAAVHRCDDGFFGARQTLRFVIQVARLGSGFLARCFIRHALAQICTRAKMFACRSQHHSPHVVVLIQALQRRGEVAYQFDIQKIIRRPAQFHRCDVAVDANADLFTTHVRLPLNCR